MTEKLDVYVYTINVHNCVVPHTYHVSDKMCEKNIGIWGEKIKKGQLGTLGGREGCPSPAFHLINFYLINHANIYQRKIHVIATANRYITTEIRTLSNRNKCKHMYEYIKLSDLPLSLYSIFKRGPPLLMHASAYIHFPRRVHWEL